MSTCDFTGSYYNPEPWANQPCGVELSVPEGCPIHLVSGAALDVTNVTTSIDSGPITPNTATVVGSDVRSFTIPDQFSCDCSPIGIAVDFKHVAIDVPAAAAGDTVHVWGTGYDSQISITPAAPCAEPAWPTDYTVALSCDRCPDQGGGGGSEGQSDDELGGCSAGGESSLAIVVVLMLLVMMRAYAQHDRIWAGNSKSGAGTRDGRRS